MPFIQLDEYLIHPALSGIFAFTFLLGVFHINYMANKLFKLSDDFVIKVCSYYTLLGFISSLMIFIALLGLVNNYFIIILYYIICGLGLTRIIYFFYNVRTNKYNQHKIVFIQNTNHLVFYLSLSILVFYFILSVTPATDADSLDYHIGFPLDILRNGDLYFKLDWKHSRVVGLGEFINLIGLIIRTDNIGSSLNFLSLCFLLLVTYNYTSNKRINIFLTLVILTTPILIQLIPNQKPQFYGVTAIVIPIIAVINNVSITTKHVFVIIGSLFFAISLKYSFYVSGGISLLFIIYTMKHKLAITILYCITLFLIFLFPLYLVKYYYFGDPISPMLSMLINNSPAEQQFYSEFITGSDGFGMPLGFLIPKSVGNLSTIAGLGILSLFTVNQVSPQSKKYFILSSILFISIFAFGQNVSRSYLEPLIILYIGIFSSINSETRKFMLIRSIVYFQLIFIFGATTTGLYALSPSLISNKYREKIMNITAHNHSVMSWVDDELPKDSCIISDFRSNALVPREFVTRNYQNLLLYETNKNIFNNCINYEYIFLLTSSEISRNHPLYKYIIFPTIANNTFRREYRNILTNGTYSGYVYRVNKLKLFSENGGDSS
jgi:hypothetical protein